MPKGKEKTYVETPHCPRCDSWLVSDTLDRGFSYCFMCVRWHAFAVPDPERKRIERQQRVFEHKLAWLHSLAHRIQQAFEDGQPFRAARPGLDGGAEVERAIASARMRDDVFEIQCAGIGWTRARGDELRAWLNRSGRSEPEPTKGN